LQSWWYARAMRVRGAWLGIAALVAMAACEIVTRVPAPQPEERPQEPFPAAGSSGGAVSVEDTGTSPDCSLPSFALIEVRAAVPWACVAAECPRPVADCTTDCLCNDVFTRALQCLNMAGSAPDCFVIAIENGQDPAVAAFVQCIASQQGSCVAGGDAGSEAEAAAADASEADAAAADASEEAGVLGSASDATLDVGSSDAAAD
jgi:hypothetical protein